MYIKFSTNQAFKKILLMIAIIVIFFSFVSCMGRSEPQGWAGGRIVDEDFITASMDGQLLSLDINSGKQNWEPNLIRVSEDEDNKRAIYGTPAIYNDIAFVAAYDGKLHAISLIDGSLIDSVTLDSSFIGGPVVYEDKLFLVSEEGILYGYKIVTSKETQKVALEPIWDSVDIAERVWSTPIIDEQIIYITSLDHSIYAVDIDTAELIWEFYTGGAIVASPLIYEDHIMFGSFDGEFYSLDKKTSDLNWAFSDSNNWYWAAPVLGYDADTALVFAPSLGGSIYAIDIETGILKWESTVENAIVGAPAIVNDMLVFGSRGNTLYVSEISSGIILGTCDVGDKIETPISVIDDIVFFGARDHSIRALKIKPNGNPDEYWDSPYFSDKAKDGENPNVLDWVPGC
ncbi:MAG: hypothetical protein CL882_04630 [Dehalococcoidia bacterium]|nr:hypothetical protein [Dehalococcoidia bacterium]|tara:strand:+ start:166 stop:1368 length:1203 start_codon:yes stop_codon:yes gene_type:complete